MPGLGHGFTYEFFTIHNHESIGPAGIVLRRYGRAVGSPWFDAPEVRAVPWSSERKFWTVVSTDPLHLEPSIQTYRFDRRTKRLVPQYHGYIRHGRWQFA